MTQKNDLPNLTVLKTKRMALETLKDALDDFDEWQGVIVLSITKQGTGKIWHSDITPQEFCYLKEVLNCEVRSIFNEEK